MLQYSSEFVYSIYAPVAQWIERSPPERKAAGSNPVRCNNYFQTKMKTTNDLDTIICGLIFNLLNLSSM